jgi:hypothetical protein
VEIVFGRNTGTGADPASRREPLIGCGANCEKRRSAENDPSRKGFTSLGVESEHAPDVVRDLVSADAAAEVSQDPTRKKSPASGAFLRAA